VIATIERDRYQQIDAPNRAGQHQLAPRPELPAVLDDSGWSAAADTARGMIATARSARVKLAWFSLDRAYFVGVEAAAEQALHPETDWVHHVNWLDRHNPAFMSGFVETSARLASMWPWPSEK
jgi:hypothetical protein